MIRIIPIETPRLYLEPLSTKFVSDDYVTWMNDREVNKYLESGGNYTREMLLEFLQDVEQKEILFWAIIEKSNHRHIGNIKIDPINHKYGNGEYGILLGDRTCWGKGYAKEASLAVIDFCFSKKVDLRKITLGVIENNKAALKLYKNLKFNQEGLLKSHTFHNGEWCNTVRMALFNPNFNDGFE